MPIPSTSAPFPPAPTGNPNPPPLGPRQVFGLVFWPVLFGVVLLLLVWGSWKWRGGFGTSKGPFSAPEPPVIPMVHAAHRRGAPAFGFRQATLGSGIPNPPPPAYVPPPKYDDIQLR